MKKNKVKNFLIIFIIIIFVIIAVLSKNSDADSSKIVETNQEIAEVSRQTINTTLTASGEVESAKLEKLLLNTSYSYLTMCAEKNEFIKEGSNLLQYTNGKFITAPYDCVIIEYSVPTAKSACTSSDYIYIASLEDLYINININEENINNISKGQNVEIISNYDESKTYQGEISKIESVGTVGNGSTNFSAIVSIVNDGNLKIGMSATCTITIESKENVLAVPIEAIQFEDNERFVNKLTSNGTYEKTIIETGKANENYVEILSGLADGDKVSYETTTITVTNTDKEESGNALTSLFNMGGNKAQGRGGFDR